MKKSFQTGSERSWTSIALGSLFFLGATAQCFSEDLEVYRSNGIKLNLRSLSELSLPTQDGLKKSRIEVIGILSQKPKEATWQPLMNDSGSIRVTIHSANTPYVRTEVQGISLLLFKFEEEYYLVRSDSNSPFKIDRALVNASQLEALEKFLKENQTGGRRYFLDENGNIIGPDQTIVVQASKTGRVLLTWADVRGGNSAPVYNERSAHINKNYDPILNPADTEVELNKLQADLRELTRKYPSLRFENAHFTTESGSPITFSSELSPLTPMGLSPQGRATNLLDKLEK